MSLLLPGGFTNNGYKVVVGIDYGTTFSGIAFVTTNNKTSDDIVVINRWPKHRDISWKTPSLIAYAAENPKLQRDSWGFEVTPSLKSYAWTKLLLDSSVELAQHDDPLLSQMYGSDGFLKLPRGKSAKKVVRDFLHQLYEHTIATLERELSSEVFKTLPMECWITMPAIWSDAAQSATLQAALQAGFGSRPNDTVNMIPEPEAAALWALKPYLGPSSLDPLQVGEYVLICDCGGGTVDLVTYEILQTHPYLQYQEKCVGTGAKCGATAIDRKFVEWMEANFGEAYTKIDLKKRGPSSSFMDNFESVKRNFSDGNEEQNYFEVGEISLDLESPSHKYDEDERCVKISRNEMRSFFDTPINALISKLDDQVVQLKKKNKAKLDRLVLVGGFGDSAYLNNRIKFWCGQNHIKRFTCPQDCQASIVRGAVLRGLEKIRPTKVIAKRHYGWDTSKNFREGIDDERHSYHSKWDGVKRCRGRMQWVVSKGQELDVDFHVQRRVSKHKFEDEEDVEQNLKLFSCSLDEAPERYDIAGVRREGVISSTFAAITDASDSRYNAKSKEWVYRYTTKVQVDFRPESGVLGFRCFKWDDPSQEVGKATISFDG